MGLQLEDILVLGDKSYGKEYLFSDQEKASLKILDDRMRKQLSLTKPLLKESQSGLEILQVDVETSTTDRDQVQLVGVMKYPDPQIFHYDHKLTRSELETLTLGAETVVFVAFNYGFDLVRAFDDDAAPILLGRSTRFGDQRVSYKILKVPGVLSYALDVMRLSNNLLDDKKRSLFAQSASNTYFRKIETTDFLDKKYNAYDLLSTFELLVRCLEKAQEFMKALDFKPSQVIDFVLKQNRNEVIESHMAPIKFFEGGSRIAKVLIAPYAKFPSFPAAYMGGRVRAFKTGSFTDYSFEDINSEYPSIMSRLSPEKMKLVSGDKARELACQTLDTILDAGGVEAFRRIYVDQSQTALTLSTLTLVLFTEDAAWLIECLKEKTKKAKKLSRYTTVYRNRREEQSRSEGIVEFKKGSVYQIPLYFLFMQSKEQLKRIRILDAAGFCYEKDEVWAARWDNLYRMRQANPSLTASLKIAMNSVSGLISDVDQFFSNLALGSHVTAFARTISFIIQRQLGEDLLYTDTDSFAINGARADELHDLLSKLTPWGSKREYVGSKELVIFRTKRYAIRNLDNSWITKGAERSGYGRERNKLLSFLTHSDRFVVNDIRQATKQGTKAPNIPAVRKILRDSQPGEWCYYFSYPLWPDFKTPHKSDRWFRVVSDVIEELESTSSGEILEDRYNHDFGKLAEWTGFLKKPSKTLARARWFLEWFEWMRSYGFSTRQELYDLVRRKVNVDLNIVEAKAAESSFRPEWETRLLSDDDELVVTQVTKSGMCYKASKVKERLIEIAEKIDPLPSARLGFESSKMEEGIPDTIFAPLFGKPDTTFLEGQLSQASISALPMALNEKMRLLAQTIGKLGHSDNHGVKLSVSTLKTKLHLKDGKITGGEIEKCEPELTALAKRSRKRSPFSQRRFYVEQQFPYKVRYHVGIDAVRDSQFSKRQFTFSESPSWLPSSLAEIINCFLKDTELLEQKLNEAVKIVIAESNNIMLKLTDIGKNVKLRVAPYARYKRFDVAYDIPAHMIKEKINEFHEICERENLDYSAGLGYIGMRGTKLTNSVNFVPGNIVVYDRNRRFDLRTNTFLRRYTPFVESWKNEDIGRIEIQCFAHKSNNRKANPFASLLNVLEMYRLRAPSLFNYVSNLLSVITHIYPDRSERSGSAGSNSQKENPIESNLFDSTQFGHVSWLAGLGLGGGG